MNPNRDSAWNFNFSAYWNSRQKLKATREFLEHKLILTQTHTKEKSAMKTWKSWSIESLQSRELRDVMKISNNTFRLRTFLSSLAQPTTAVIARKQPIDQSLYQQPFIYSATACLSCKSSPLMHRSKEMSQLTTASFIDVFSHRRITILMHIFKCI